MIPSAPIALPETAFALTLVLLLLTPLAIAGLALIKGAGARVRAARGLLDSAKATAMALPRIWLGKISLNRTQVTGPHDTAKPAM